MSEDVECCGTIRAVERRGRESATYRATLRVAYRAKPGVNYRDTIVVTYRGTIRVTYRAKPGVTYCDTHGVTYRGTIRGYISC